MTAITPINEWIATVDAEREQNGDLARGAWHGYLNIDSVMPFAGLYVLCRWATPSIAVAHDDPHTAIRIAKAMERQMASMQEIDATA